MIYLPSNSTIVPISELTFDFTKLARQTKSPNRVNLAKDLTDILNRNLYYRFLWIVYEELKINDYNSY